MAAKGEEANKADQIELEPYTEIRPPYARQPTFTRQASTFSTRPSKTRKDPNEKWSMKTLGRSMKHSVADFFGVGDDEDDDYNKLKWAALSMKLHSGNRVVGGQVKKGQLDSLSYDTLDGSVFADSAASARLRGMQLHDPLHRPTAARQDSHLSGKAPSAYSRQLSRISTASSSKRSARGAPHYRCRKDSVFKMAYDGLRTFSGSMKYSKRKPTAHSRSFAPTSVSSALDEPDTAAVRNKKKSPTMDSMMTDESVFLDDLFFDTPTPTSPLAQAYMRRRVLEPPTPDALASIPEAEKSARESAADIDGAAPEVPPGALAVPSSVREQDDSEEEILVPVMPAPFPLPEDMRPTKGGWQIGRKMPIPAPGTPEFGLDETEGPMLDAMKKMKDTVIDTALDNSDRRQLGQGCIGRLFKREYKEDAILDADIKEQLALIESHRPYFTYWVTFVQIVIFIISVAVYGIAPIGFEETLISDEVLKHNLAVEKVSYPEKDNLWIGPRQADLIHLGAKFSPCMRLDENVEKEIEKGRLKEKETACCIRNDGSGCVQTIESDCSPTLSLWLKWSKGKLGSEDPTSGSVCGQDPMYCKDPASVFPAEWSDDITKWPICKDSTLVSSSEETKHMTCDVAGRPCCVGVQGECIITTREYCTFRRGYFHEEATLCAQISCMNEICGMIQFLDPAKPDQFYRLWTSLFLHAGFLQLVVSVLFQFFIMRDMEKLAGWLRICIIYIGSGIAGSLASAIFLPYHVEAGPAGSQFGILACLVVEVVQNWSLLKNPGWALGKLLIVILVLFIIGLLPLVDNYAHLFGFIFGFLLSFALLPYVTFGKKDKNWKLFGVIFCLFMASGLFALLIVLFYVTPVYHCPYCHYFNCIPLTKKFCQSMEVRIDWDQSYY